MVVPKYMYVVSILIYSFIVFALVIIETRQ